ncbi:hypothetical protein ACK1M2_004205, partial [Providencia rettgeri]
TQTRRPIDKETLRLFDIASEAGECFHLGYNADEPFEKYHLEFFPYGQVCGIINLADKDGNIKGKIEITDVRVEQLNHISEEDARAEGILMIDDNFGNGPAYCDYTLTDLYDTTEWFNRASDSFISLWKSIYEAESWLN